MVDIKPGPDLGIFHREYNQHLHPGIKAGKRTGPGVKNYEGRGCEVKPYSRLVCTLQYTLHRYKNTNTNTYTQTKAGW